MKRISVQIHFFPKNRFFTLILCLLVMTGTVALSQGTAACPCAGVTTTTVNGTSGSQTSTAAQNWTSVSGTGASYSLSGIFSISMETLTFTIPATAIPLGTRFCSVTDPVPVINGNSNVGLIGSSYDVTGSYSTGYTVTVDVSFTGVSALGTATVTVSGISYSIVTQTGCVLPVELIGFSGKQEGRCAKLAWTTATEQENDFFTVQKLIGETYVDIGRVESHSGTTQLQSSYEFVDCDVSGMNYYRLYQTDNNGSEEFIGDMIAVPVDLADPGQLSVIPNPAENFTCIHSDEELESVRVISSEGKVVALQTFADEETQHCLDVAGLVPGVYTIQAVTTRGAYSRRMVKH